jgi:putative protein-disulfide isomerase
MVNNEVNMKAILYYVYDPMCSWCWGYAPTWQQLKDELTQHIKVVYGVGGLAEDSSTIMPDEMQVFLQRTWQKISQQLGTQFNYDFWQRCQPRRSTFPACRAILVARASGKELEMLAAIQQAYYLQARNPSDIDTLQALAIEIGLDENDFLQQMSSQKIEKALQSEIVKVRAMPISGFPSLVLVKEQTYTAIPIDYKDWRKSFDMIMANI